MADRIRVVDKDMGYGALSKTLADIGKHKAKAGLVAGEAEAEVIKYGAKNHFGDEGVPARPWLTQAWDAGGVVVYGDTILEAIDDYLEDGKTSHVANGFDAASQIAAEDMQSEIVSGNFEPNSPETRQAKGGDEPLIESGELLAQIGWKLIVGDKPFKPADDASSIARIIRGGPRGRRKKKRGRRVGLRRRVSGFAALARDPGYEGRGIRKSPQKRRKAAGGVASRGVRRKGLGF